MYDCVCVQQVWLCFLVESPGTSSLWNSKSCKACLPCMYLEHKSNIMNAAWDLWHIMNHLLEPKDGPIKFWSSQVKSYCHCNLLSTFFIRVKDFQSELWHTYIKEKYMFGDFGVNRPFNHLASWFNFLVWIVIVAKGTGGHKHCCECNNVSTASELLLKHVFVPPGGSLTERFMVKLPKNVIDGSDRASVSVLGNQTTWF